MDGAILRSPKRAKRFSGLAVVFAAGLLCPIASADIFQWEWVDPDNHDAGKMQATVLAPDGAGKVAQPNGVYTGLNLSNAFLLQADLRYAQAASVVFSSAYLPSSQFGGAVFSNANFANADLVAARFNETKQLSPPLWSIFGANLTNANFDGANLHGADFNAAKLTGASFGGATIDGANFNAATTVGFTSQNLYSTASYLDNNLRSIVLSSNDLSGWDFSHQDLYRAIFCRPLFGIIQIGLPQPTPSNLTNANFSFANLDGANLGGTTLSGANFTGAQIAQSGNIILLAGSNFHFTTPNGFTAAQLYSTQSYQDQDLKQVNLSANDLSGWNFAQQNLFAVDFSGSDVTGATFTDAAIHFADFSHATGLTEQQLASTASYQAHILKGFKASGNDMTGWNLAGQDIGNSNLSDATLSQANLSGTKLRFTSLAGSTLSSTNFSGADVQDVSLGDTTSRGFTKEQLYSTASYQQHLLGNLGMEDNDLSGWIFADQVLTRSPILFSYPGGSRFNRSNLTGANFRGASLADSEFTDAILAGADFTTADLRGAVGFSAGGITTNAILPDGTITGLNLGTGQFLSIGDHDSFSGPISIHITGTMTLAPGASLNFVLQDADWASLISFDPAIPVNLDGTLMLGFAPDADMASLIGTSWQLFNWTGVTPIGTFDQILTLPGTVWDTSDLYTTGFVTLQTVPEPAIGGSIIVSFGLALSRRAKRIR